jgi:hypothetical protein
LSTKGRPPVDDAKVADATATANFAICDAIAQTVHLTRINAESASILALVEAVAKNVTSPSFFWAFQVLSDIRRDAEDPAKGAGENRGRGESLLPGTGRDG